MDMEKELLQKALDSLLHGSTQIISEVDSYGNLQHREVRINDLRVPLIEKLASKLVNTPAFALALEKAFTAEVMKKIQETVLKEMKFSDLPYQLKEELNKQMIKEGVALRKMKVILEVIEKDEHPR